MIAFCTYLPKHHPHELVNIFDSSTTNIKDSYNHNLLIMYDNIVSKQREVVKLYQCLTVLFIAKLLSVERFETLHTCNYQQINSPNTKQKQRPTINNTDLLSI